MTTNMETRYIVFILHRYKVSFIFDNQIDNPFLNWYDFSLPWSWLITTFYNYFRTAYAKIKLMIIFRKDIYVELFVNMEQFPYVSRSL